MKRPSVMTSITAIGFLVCAGHLCADTISRWVDAEGVTHFGDVQFAPAGAATVVVRPANGMEVPEGTDGRSHTANGPHWTRLSLPPKHNKKGWRSRGESLYTGRKHRQNRTYRR